MKIVHPKVADDFLFVDLEPGTVFKLSSGKTVFMKIHEVKIHITARPVNCVSLGMEAELSHVFSSEPVICYSGAALVLRPGEAHK